MGFFLPKKFQELVWMVSSGQLLIATGMGHEIVGFIIPELRDRTIAMLRHGWFNTSNGVESYSRWETATCFWFHWAGVLMVVTGWLMHCYEKDCKKPLPASFAWMFLVLSIMGVVACPLSGFWLGLAIAIRQLWCTPSKTR